MTKRVVTLTFCDLPHDEEVPAETVSFVQARETVEVDLCAVHRDEVLGPLVKAGRTVRKPGRKPRASA
jgi:hypothetical protein